MFDTDGSGTMKTADLSEAVVMFGCESEEEKLKAWVREADPEHTGSIDFNDFLLVMSEVLTKENEAMNLKEAFDLFDKDGGGTISPIELRHMMTSIGERITEEETDLMVQLADKDGARCFEWV